MQSVQESWHTGENRVLDTDAMLEEGVIVLDPHMRLRFANPTAVAMLGASADNLLVHEWDRAGQRALREPIEEVVHKGLLVRERDVELNARERLGGAPPQRLSYCVGCWEYRRGCPAPARRGAGAHARTRSGVCLTFQGHYRLVYRDYPRSQVPLHAVIMHLEMLRKEVGGDSRGGEDKKAVRYIDSITQEIKRLETIIRAFWTMPRPSRIG